jgi:hypothetical protein
MQALLTALYDSALAKAIRDSLLAFPLIEAAHVIAITLVFGTIAIVDLRLLGVASGHRPFTRLAPEILKWTWIAFALAVVTGGLMFISNAHVYFENLPFRIKMVLMLLAGINMGVFQVLAHRSVHLWDDRAAAPLAGRAAAVLSLALWLGVIGAGRLIGFTSTQRATEAAPPADVDFDNFLSDSAGPPPPAPAK